jgi:hypothetical protein
MCVDLLTGGGSLYRDWVSTQRPVLSPHLETAVNKLKFYHTLSRPPAEVYSLVGINPLHHQKLSQAPPSVLLMPFPSPSVAPTKTGRHWIHVSSLYLDRFGSWAYQQCNWLYAALHAHIVGNSFEPDLVKNSRGVWVLSSTISKFHWPLACHMPGGP